ncbi:MAG: diguanylate cyclase [Planctomycetes bacterium]|nr:diguanylate cyclase [Planctomycetota bacterium]
MIPSPELEDDLPGLANRRALLRQLETAPLAEPTTLLLFDLDGFGALNQRAGHEAGDRALSEAARRLRNAVGAEGMIGRAGSDSFFVLLPGADKERAVNLAERVRGLLREPFPAAGPAGLSACAGIATFPDDAAGGRELLEAAQRALQASRQGGKDRSCAAQPESPATNLPCPILTGRQGELQSALATLLGPTPPVLLVQGEPGSGKSRFLFELARKINAAGVAACFAAAVEPTVGRPADALIRLIERFYGRQPDALITLRARLTPPQRALMRELMTVCSDWIEEDLETSDRRLLTLQAVEVAIRSMAEFGPMVLLFDNADTLDRSTMDILRAILRDRRAPIGLVMAGLPSPAPLENVPATQLTLSPLPEDDVRAMVAAILPAAPPGLADAIAVSSGGLPLYVELSIRTLILRNQLRRPKLLGSLDAAVACAFDLPSAVGELLVGASVLGVHFDAQTLHEVLARREAEFFDTLDHAVDAGLIRRLPEGSCDEFEFASGTLHAARLRTAPTDIRQRIHQRVADVLRFRSVQQPDLDPAEIARHVALGRGTSLSASPGDTTLRRLRIPHAAAPLSPEAQSHALAFVEALATLVKMRRLYPQWPDAGTKHRMALAASIRPLLMEAPALTFAPDRKGLKANGAVLESEPAIELGRLLEDQLVASLTVRIGLEPRELHTLVSTLAVPIEKASVGPETWERILRREDIRHIDILQGRISPREFDTVRKLYDGGITERPLDASETESLRATLHAVKIAAESLRVFPPDHAPVEEALSRAAAALAELLAKVRILTLRTAQDALEVNGKPVDSGGEGVIRFFVEELHRKAVGHFTLRDPLASDEARAFVSFLACEDFKTAKAPLVDASVRHLSFVMHTTKHTAARVLDLPPGESMRIDLRARAWLRAPIRRLASPLCEREFPALLNALDFGAFAGLAAQLLDRLAACLTDRNPQFRAYGAVIAARALDECSGDTRKAVLTRLRQPLLERLAAESDPIALRTLPDVLRAWLGAALATAPLPVAADFIGLGIKPKLEAEGTRHEFKTLLLSKLRTLSPAAAPAIEKLKAGPDVLRRAAVRILGTMGPTLTAPLIEIITASEDHPVRAAAASALKEIGGSAQTELANLIRADAPPETLVRVLEVLELAGTENIATPVLTALRHADPAVGKAAFGLIKRIDRGMAAVLLRKMLPEGNPAVVRAALSVARELKLTELASDVAELMRATEFDVVVREACAYWREVPSPAAVTALRHVFERKAKMFGLMKGFTEETRAAAIEAAARINHPSARELVSLAQADRSEIVRRAAGSPIS